MKVELLESTAITENLSEYWRVSVFDEVSSTQEVIKENHPKSWELVVAEFQSAGRGRLDRTFEAPKNSALLFSFYIEPKRNKEDWGFIPLIAGAVVASSINNLTKSKNYTCKWPNDILAGDKKIAGILSETFGQGVILGIGINVSTQPTDLPTDQASSIYLESNKIINRNSLLSEICNNFRTIFAQWDSGSDLREFYLELCSTINRQVKIITPSGEKNGQAIGIAKSGSLLLASGEEITVGDLIHLKA